MKLPIIPAHQVITSLSFLKNLCDYSNTSVEIELERHNICYSYKYDIR